MDMASLEDFLLSSPGRSFNAAPEAVVTAALAEAEAQTSLWAYLGTYQRNLAVYYKAAITLARTPGAQAMAAAPGAVENWEKELSGLQRSNTMGLRVF